MLSNTSKSLSFFDQKQNEVYETPDVIEDDLDAPIIIAQPVRKLLYHFDCKH
jgi:uncharacterized membrane protein